MRTFQEFTEQVSYDARQTNTTPPALLLPSGEDLSTQSTLHSAQALHDQPRVLRKLIHLRLELDASRLRAPRVRRPAHLLLVLAQLPDGFFSGNRELLERFVQAFHAGEYLNARIDVGVRSGHVPDATSSAAYHSELLHKKHTAEGRTASSAVCVLGSDMVS